MTAEPPPALLLSDDLLDASRVAATARAQGLTLKQARSAAALLQLAREQAPACVIVDLQNAGLDVADLLAKLREGRESGPRVIGYGSHVDAARLRAARQAGCDEVMPRSQFFERLEADFVGWLKMRG